MQPKMRETIDADLHENQVRASRIKTEQHPYELKCGICFGDYFVDNVTHAATARSIELGLDNPFVCDECQLEFEEAAHQDG